MSKKKRNKLNDKYHIPATPYDSHHLLWIGKHWNYGYLEKLRKYWYCKALVPRVTLHRYIHRNLQEIPVPREESAKSVLEQLKLLEFYGAIHQEDSVEQRLKILIALFEYLEPLTAKALERQLILVREFNNPST